MEFVLHTHFLFSDLNAIKSSKNFLKKTKKTPSSNCDVLYVQSSVVTVWPFLGCRRPSWEVEEIRWCDGPNHWPNAGAWAEVETEIKTNGVS